MLNRAEREKLVNENANSSETAESAASIVKDSLPVSKFALNAALVVEVAVITLLVVVVFVEVYVREPGSLSNSDHALYVTGTTVAASAIAAFVASQIKVHWLARILPTSNNEEGHEARRAVDRGRVILGLGSWHQIYQHSLVMVSLLIVGLNTSSIVAGISPSTTLVHSSLMEQVLCNDTYDDFYVSGNCSAAWFCWQMSNGSFLNVNTSWSEDVLSSPIRQVQNLLGNYLQTPVGYAYAAEGVAVGNGAIGTPYSLSGGGYPSALGLWGSKYGATRLLQSSIICSPVLTSNPVKCDKMGNITSSTNNLTVEVEGCRIESPIFGANPRIDSASSLGACSHDQPMGKATIVIGSVYAHATRLANSMVDSLPAPLEAAGYAVSCTVDIQPSLGFRLMNYSRIVTDDDPLGLSGNSFVIESSGQSCTPNTASGPVQLTSFISESMLATGAAASWQLLSENAYRDGWWNLLWHIVQSTGGQDDLPSDFHFNDSRNPLEDALSLASGIALGNFWGNGAVGDESFLSIETSTFVDGLSNRARPAVGFSFHYASCLCNVSAYLCSILAYQTKWS